MSNLYLQIFIHWLHIISAIMALGGSILLRIAVHPALAGLDPETRATIEHKLIPKARKTITHGILLLMITGVFNLIRIYTNETPLPAPYTMLLALKVLLAFVLMFLTVAILTPSEAFENIQARKPFWMMINIFVGVTIVLLSVTIGLLRDAHRDNIEVDLNPPLEIRELDLGDRGGAVPIDLNLDH